MAKRRIGKYSRAFRQRAVERLKCCDNAKELAKELGVHRSVLYQWRDQLAPQDRPEWQGEKGEAARLAQEIRLLKQSLAEKTLELDFFKGALQKVGARRHSNKAAGGRASTTKSGSGCPCKAN